MSERGNNSCLVQPIKNAQGEWECPLCHSIRGESSGRLNQSHHIYFSENDDATEMKTTSETTTSGEWHGDRNRTMLKFVNLRRDNIDVPLIDPSKPAVATSEVRGYIAEYLRRRPDEILLWRKVAKLDQPNAGEYYYIGSDQFGNIKGDVCCKGQVKDWKTQYLNKNDDRFHFVPNQNNWVIFCTIDNFDAGEKTIVNANFECGAFGSVSLYHGSKCGHYIEKSLHDDANKEGKTSMQDIANEIRLLINLKHPAIIECLGAEQRGNQLFLYLEYMPDGPLRRKIEQDQGLCEDLTSIYTRQILQGLSYLHNLRIIHRDIKSANILRDGCTVKIADLGLSRHLDVISTGARSKNVGTKGWMAPEIVQGGTYAFTADIWSMASTVIEMMTQCAPDHFDMRERDESIILEQLCKNLPENASAKLKHFLDSCFRIDAEKRPSAKELLNHDFCKCSLPQ